MRKRHKRVADVGSMAYREKQREYLEAGVNLVEIDLLREGAMLVAVPEALVPVEYRKPYLVCVRRAADLAALNFITHPFAKRCHRFQFRCVPPTLMPCCPCRT